MNIGRWKLGGSALLVGGLLWLISALFQVAGLTSFVALFAGPGLIIIGLGHLALASSLSATARPGPGASTGIVALVGAAVCWVVFGAAALWEPVGMLTVMTVIRTLALLAEIIAAIVITQVVRGVSRWMLILPAGWMLVTRAGELIGIANVGWNALLLAACFLVTGFVYIGYRAPQA